jgi:hypothetical protein
MILRLKNLTIDVEKIICENIYKTTNTSSSLEFGYYTKCKFVKNIIEEPINEPYIQITTNKYE